jgi:hypothetical protein
MADPVVEQLRQLQCPAGSTPQIDLDTNTAGCFKPDGTQVESLSSQAVPAGSSGHKIIAWSVLISAVLVSASFHIGGSSHGRASKRRW